MSQVLKRWDDFSGGHWGNMGPARAPKNQYGGANMVGAHSGGVVLCCSSRWLELTDLEVGKVWGVFYAWGVDGRVYFVQSNVDGDEFYVRRFTPDPSAPATVETVGQLLHVDDSPGVVVVEPDWAVVNDLVYLTVWADKTYAIDPTAPTVDVVTGFYGDAPAGRSIAVYGVRIVVGGVSDERFGVNPNGLYWSGDDSNDIETDRTAWEDLSFVNFPNYGVPITAICNQRDVLSLFFSDGQIFTLAGPVEDGDINRMYGFHKGVGAVESFKASQVAVDPSQTRVYAFDHPRRTPARFNGSQYVTVEDFGVVQDDRTATALVEGAMAMVGGPDEFVMDGVAVTRGAGEAVIDTTTLLLRYRGQWAVLLNAVIAARQT